MPTNLGDIYEAATSDQLTRVKMQASGIARPPSAIGTYPPNNFMVDDFQSEFTSRNYGDRATVQSTIDDATEGTFEDRALNFYSEQVDNNRLTQYKSQIVHLYNARAVQTHYKTLYAATRGVISQYGA